MARKYIAFLLGSVAIGTLFVAVAACGGGDDDAALEQEVTALSIQLTSTAFAQGADIPVKYTCDDEQEVSPSLRWSGVPVGTRSDSPSLPTTRTRLAARGSTGCYTVFPQM